MKKNIFLFIAFCIAFSSYSQEETTVFKKGEWLRYKMSYSGFFKAGNATLSIDTDTINGKEVFHVTGKGWTTGVIKWFFKVNDTYESYFDKETIKPYVFKRNINEGGYKINREVKFNYETQKATVTDFRLQTKESVNFTNIQDMMSSFYYLRNHDVSKLKVGDGIDLDMFLDSQVYPFKLRFLGTEILKTSFGKIKTLKFRPMGFWVY